MAYISGSPRPFWSCWSLEKSHTHPINTSKLIEVLSDQILRVSTCFVSASARLALEVSEWARLCALCFGSRREPPLVLGVPGPWSIGGSPATVIDPPAWCGAAKTSLCGGRGDPHPSWWSSLVEPGPRWPWLCLRKRLGGREAILFVSTSTTWM